MATLAYVDESGDFGFKRFGKGTTDYVVIALLLLDDPGPLFASIDEARIEFGMRAGEEFRFSKTSHERRLRFLEIVRRHDLSIRGIAILKSLELGMTRLGGRETLHLTLVRELLRRNRDALTDTTVVFDEYVRGRNAQQSFNTAIRQALNQEGERRIKEIHHRRSHGDPLIQVADMVAGAIYASRARGNDSYLDAIRSRVHEIWDWDGGRPPVST